MTVYFQLLLSCMGFINDRGNAGQSLILNYGETTNSSGSTMTSISLALSPCKGNTQGYHDSPTAHFKLLFLINGCEIFSKACLIELNFDDQMYLQIQPKKSWEPSACLNVRNIDHFDVQSPGSYQQSVCMGVVQIPCGSPCTLKPKRLLLDEQRKRGAAAKRLCQVLSFPCPASHTTAIAWQGPKSLGGPCLMSIPRVGPPPPQYPIPCTLRPIHVCL